MQYLKKFIVYKNYNHFSTLFLPIKSIFVRFVVVYYILLGIVFSLLLGYILVFIIPTTTLYYSPQITSSNQSFFLNMSSFFFSRLNLIWLAMIGCCIVNLCAFMLLSGGYVVKSISSSFIFMFLVKALYTFIRTYHSTRISFQDVFCHIFGYDLVHVYTLQEKLSFCKQYCTVHHLDIDVSVLSFLSSKASSISELTFSIIEYSELTIFDTLSTKSIWAFIQGYSILSSFTTIYYSHWIAYSTFLALATSSVFVYKWWNKPSGSFAEVVETSLQSHADSVNTVASDLAKASLLQVSLSNKVTALEETIFKFNTLFAFLTKALYITTTAVYSTTNLDIQPLGKYGSKLINVVFNACTNKPSLEMRDLMQEVSDTNSGSTLDPVRLHFPGEGHRLGSRTESDNLNPNTNNNGDNTN